MRLLLLLLLSVVWSLQSAAQCETCTPDTTCIVSPAFPTLCPDALPDATAGEFYETDINFYLPYQFFEPDNGVDVQFNQVIVTGTTGLPFGMSITLSEESGIYTPSESEHGCAKLCGTPLSPGTYNISINIVAVVFVPSFGVEVNQPQSFDLELTVLPGTGGNNSFIFDTSTGCDSVFVNFEALLNASPNPTSYSWDFGNGETSSEQFPETQFYPDTGSYEVTLITEFLQFVITEAHVTSVNGDWCGDAEEPTCDGIFGILPDVYVQIRDANANLIYQSSSTSNTLTGSWTGLNIIANNGPFTVQVWDEDAVSSDDNLGSFSFNVTSAGNINFSGAGGTSGFLVVETQVSDTFTNTETITVFPSPEPLIDIDELTGFLTVSADSSFVGYTWFFNDELIPGENGSAILATEPGVYYAVVQNGFGCVGTSNLFVVCPNPIITYSSQSGIVSSVQNWESYQWYYNGEPIPGANQQFYAISGDYGLYSLEITTSYGCEVISTEVLVCPSVQITTSEDGMLSVPDNFETYQWVQSGIPIQGANGPEFMPVAGGTYWVVVTTDYGCQISSPSVQSTVSLNEYLLPESGFSLYPNPANDGFNLRATTDITHDVNIRLANIQGRTVIDYGEFSHHNMGYNWFNLGDVAPGQYFVVISNAQHQAVLRLVVR